MCIGQHQVVSLINNFLQYEEVEYFTRIQGKMLMISGRYYFKTIIFKNMFAVLFSQVLKQNLVYLHLLSNHCTTLFLTRISAQLW